jgi:4-diphosphocytidyl-2-C-methyl-D-erythritol kinase
MQLERLSPCKVNLILNILGKRPDGYHELETVMHPVQVFDHLVFRECTNPLLPTDASNLVYKAALKFFEATGRSRGVRIHLEKNLPLAAGLGGGSANAAQTLLGLNELLGSPLPAERLSAVAAELGSDVPFFLQEKPAIGLGRGEQVQSLENFPALAGAYIFLIHPGFGVSTPWAYKNLARFPEALNGRAGRAMQLVRSLRDGALSSAAPDFYNSLEAPVLEKYPLLAIFKEFLLENGAAIALMSGSGSSTFGMFPDQTSAEAAREQFRSRFGDSCWLSLTELA